MSLNSSKVLRVSTGISNAYVRAVYTDFKPSNLAASLPPQSQQLEEHPTLDNDTHSVACDMVSSTREEYIRDQTA